MVSQKSNRESCGGGRAVMATNLIFTCWSSFIWSFVVRVHFLLKNVHHMTMHFYSHPFTLKCLIYCSRCMCLQIWYLKMEWIRFYKLIFYFFPRSCWNHALPPTCGKLHAIAHNIPRLQRKKMRSIYSNDFSFCFFGIYF